MDRIARLAALLAFVVSACVLTPYSAGAAVTTKTYVPPSGTWHLLASFSYGSGSFVVTKNHKFVSHFSFVPEADYSCGGKITLAGPLRLHRTKDKDRNDVGNWSVAKVFDGVIKVKIRQGGKLSRAKLQLDLEPRNGSSHPVKYVAGNLYTKRCGDLLLGGAHGKI
jgi:hypothetical protein